MNIQDLLQAQYVLQRDAFGTDPLKLEDEAFAAFVRYNVLAAQVELAEFLQEIPWKPWKDDQGRPDEAARARAVEELVDVLHFLANLFLALRVHPEELEAVYAHKRAVNAHRQEERQTPHQVIA